MFETFLDTEACPTIALAMGVVGMMGGYPLTVPIEYVTEMDRCPEEAEFEILIEEEDDY